MQKAITVLIAFFVVSFAFAVDKEEFDAVVNFDVTLADIPAIAAALDQGRPVEDRVVILEGTVSGSVVLVPEPENFEAILFFMTGRWDGLEEVETFECYVRVAGREFADRVPARVPRDPPPETILVNSTVLVAGVVAGLTMDGTVLIDALYVRNTD